MDAPVSLIPTKGAIQQRILRRYHRRLGAQRKQINRKQRAVVKALEEACPVSAAFSADAKRSFWNAAEILAARLRQTD